MGEYTIRQNWRPFYGLAASAKARHERYQAEADEKERAGDLAGAEMLRMKAQRLYERSLRTFTIPSSLLLVRRDVAMRYLAIVATKASKELKTDLFAEDMDCADVALSSISASRATVALTTLEAYLPRNLAALEPKRLAEFRADAAQARIRFQGAIQSLVKEYADVSSEGELRALEGRISDAARERIEQTRQSYKRARL
jgi:hypothetical protein